MNNGLRVVSLFDGISCGRVALERTGYAISYYAAYEIDKYAKAISRYQYPDIVHNGDVMLGDFTQFTDIDIIIGGSPCQKFSIAQSSKSREIEKGGVGWELFMKYVEAVRTIKPAHFLYENVASMHKNMRQYITEELGCEPIMINSSLVSAQQRKRLYWTNIKGVTQPQDRGILLKDILETGITPRSKSVCIDACYYKGGNHKSPHKQSGKRLMVYDEVEHLPPIAISDKSQTILSTLWKENALSMIKRQKMGLYVAHEVLGVGENGGILVADEGVVIDALGAALRTRADENGSFKRLEVRGDGKLNALTTVQTDSVVCAPANATAIGRGERIYSVRNKTVSLVDSSGVKLGIYKIDLPDGDYIVRKLTITEAERCQGLDDGYTAMGIDDNGKLVNISNTQRYKTIGNGWQIDTVAHILSFMKGA